MIFKRNLTILSLLALALGLSSCDQLGGGAATSPEAPATPPASAGFAIIDLDLVAQRLGQDTALQNALAQRQTQINQELGAMRQNYQNQVQQQEQLLIQQEQAGQPRTQQQQAALLKMAQDLNVQLQQAQNTGQATLNQDQITLIQNFRNQIRPVAVTIARERGFGLVLTKNEAVLFAYDEQNDISMEVVARVSTPVVP